MRNGFIYVAVKFIIDKLCLINLVEYFKKVGLWLNPDKTNRDMEATYTRVATDIFIVLKWLFIALVWYLQATNIVVTVIVWYLIISNLYTYFFHHIWTDEALDTSHFTNDRIRRRFINLVLAVTYSEIAFAFLYRFKYVSDFSWTTEPSSLHAVWFSISNSFAANYAVVAPSTDVGNTIATIQLLITFIFVTIIISRSIPQKS
jgi:hypothetical protein